jgi:hypothetical protein
MVKAYEATYSAAVLGYLPKLYFMPWLVDISKNLAQ